MTDDVLPNFGRSDDMVLPVFDRGALAVAEQEQQRQRGEPNLPAPAYPPAVDLGFGGPARSQMTFGENFRGAGSGTDLIGVMGEAAQMEAARGAPQPGGFQPSQLRNLPSRVRQRIEAESTPEEMAARREAAYQAVFDQAAYDLSQSRITPQSVGGTIARGLLSPENALSVPARLAVRGGEMALAGIRAIAPRLGRSETAARIAQSGVDAAITNTAIDPILQAGRIQSGGQDGYNPEQTALAPVVGGAAGALLRGAIEAPSFARREAQAFGVDPARIETPQSVGTEATGAPAGAAGEARIATPEAPAAREGQTVPDAGPVQRQAEAVSPEPARIEAGAGEPVDRGAAVGPPQLVVARQMPDGSVRYGKPGEIHAHLLDDADMAREFPVPTDAMGFAIPGGPFMSRAEALAFVRTNEPARAFRAHDPTGLQAEQYRLNDPAAPEPARAAPIGEAVASIPQHRVATTAGSSIEVVPVVVEASAVRASSDAGYDAAIQPRDRDRAASQAQIREMASRLDPERLGFSSEADRGAPIVGPDGMVESGNGRVMAIRQAYAAGGEAAQRYRDWLTRQGVDVSRFREPVIVRQRITDLTPEQRARFAVEANQAATLQMSAAERAIADARMMSADMFDLLRDPSNLMAAANRDFVRAFVRGLPQTEQGSLVDAGGILSQEGASRVRNAVLASAYGDSPVLTRVSESTDDNARSLSNGLVMAAPEWARLKADIGSGRVPAEFDLTPQLMEAVTRTIDLRSRGMNLKAYMAQMDAFDRLTDNVDRFMRMFYDPKGSRAASAERISDAVRFYAQEARKVSADMGLDLGLSRVTPDEIQGASLGRGQNEGQQNLFSGGARDGEGGDQGRFAALGQKAGRGSQAGEVGGDISPMARQTADTTADRRFPGRQELPGEASKPRSMPENATPDEIRNTRLGDAQQELAARLGRKLEVDGRFSIRNAEGQYDFKQGVIRVRQYGDMEVFSHEFGHALEQQIRTDTGAKFDSILTRHTDELRRLDANTDDPGAQTVREGLAEFMRMLINNPAFAAKQAPNFATALDNLLAADAPALRQIIDDASRLSQIDSGRNPVQAAEAMIRPAVEPRGLAELRDINKKAGLPTTLGIVMDRFFANVTGRDHYGKRLLRNLQDAQFEKTGKPMDEFGWNNPYKMLRALQSAKQTGIDAIQNGVRAFGRYNDGPVSPSFREALKEAGGGNIARMTDETTPEYRAFSAYTTMRAARGRYMRFMAGDLPKAPVRMSFAEVEKAIADFEAANPAFKSAADKVFAFNRAQWRRLYDAGITDKEMFEAVAGRGEDYVPLNRYFDDRQPGGSGGGVNASNPIRAAKGSTRDILDPIQQTMLNTAMFERVIAINEINKAFAKVAESAGEFGGRFWERIPNTQVKGQSVDILEAIRNKARERGLDKADTETVLRTMEDFVGDDATARVFRIADIKADTGENILFVWEGGQRQAYKLSNDEMTRGFYDLIASMTEADRDFWKKLMGSGNAMFSQFITNAPQFALKNLIMDAITRAPMARHTGLLGRVPFAPLAAGVWTHITDREFSKAYAAMGGIRGGVVSSALRDLEKTGGLSAIDIGSPGVGQRLAEAGGDIRRPGTYIPAVVGAGIERAREFGHTLAHPSTWPKAAAESVRDAVKAYFKLLEATETVGRVGQTKIVYNHLRKQGLDDYTAFHAAVFEGRDVLDYDRRGAAMEGLTRFLPFLNPGIQGTARANKNLIGDPLAAAIQAYKRGGYDKLDGEHKSALRDAALNWGVIAAMVTVSLGWWASVKDDPIYQRTSEYMRKRYWIIPLREGQDGKDDEYISIPKPFDLPGAIIAAVEGAAEGIHRADPEGASRVFGALREGFIPRQFGGLQDFLGSNPFFKTGYEVQLGQRMGFEGSAPSPIIPQQLRKMPKPEQFTGNTSEFARRMGRQVNVSPLIVDHVINGLGGTAGRDVNDALTAVFGDNPNMTPGDAFTKMFFGAILRRQRGVGQMRNELNRLMSADEAKYSVPANGYADAVRYGRREEAERAYAAQDEIGKSLMTVTGHSFSSGNRNLHPLQNIDSFAKMASAVTRDLSLNRLVVQDRSAARGQERDIIRVEPAVARGITNTLNSWTSEEIKNGLTIAGLPGYREMPVTDTAARLAAIRSLSPEVAAEIEARMKASAILSPIHVRDNWPEARRRLLADRQNADLTDLMPQALRRQSTQSRRRRQRAEESNNSD